MVSRPQSVRSCPQHYFVGHLLLLMLLLVKYQFNLLSNRTGLLLYQCGIKRTKRFPVWQAAEQTSRSSTPTSSSSTLNPSTLTLKNCLHSSAEFGEACECGGAEESCGQREPRFRFSSGPIQGFLALGLQKTRSDSFVDSRKHFLFHFFDFGRWGIAFLLSRLNQNLFHY